VDFRNVHLGQKAEMHLDAYPGLALPATLEQLSPLGHKDNSANWCERLRCSLRCKGRTRDCCPICRAALDLDLGSASKELVVPRRALRAKRKMFLRG